MQVDQARSRVEELQKHLDVLLLKRDDLNSTLDAIGREVKLGQVDRVPQVSVVREELSHVDEGLATARRDLQTAETALAQAVEHERRREFETYLDKARGAKAEFVRLFRECCLTLGTFAVSTQRATELSNEIGLQGKIPELWRRLDPYAEWSGIVEHRGWGYDLRFPVCPFKRELTSQEDQCSAKTK